MTSCNASPATLTLSERIKIARIALNAKQDDLSTLWELPNRQVISDWERGKNEIPTEMLPKIEQIEGWAAAGGKIDDVRAELARLKDRELATQLERVKGKAATWVTLGSRPVEPLIQPAQLELGAPQSAPQSAPQTNTTPVDDVPTYCVVEPIAPQSAPQTSPQSDKTAAAAASDPAKVTIDWEAFVVEVDGQRGVSLRALVSAGLFERMDHGVRALKASGAGFSPVRGTTSAQGGRPSEDCLMSLRDAQRFCSRVRTPVGEQILDCILDHHEEFQRLIVGDAGAAERLAEAQETTARIDAASAADPLLGTLIALTLVRQTQLDHDTRLAALETRDRLRVERERQMIAEMEALPAPTKQARNLTTRKMLVALVQRVAHAAGGREAYHDRWVHLYSQFEHRYSVDIKTRAKNRGMEPLDYAEQADHLDDLYALASSIWRPAAAAGDARA